MTTYVQNPFFNNENIQRISGNLINAFRPDSNYAVNAQQAERLRLENEKTRTEMGARSTLATAVDTLDTTNPVTAQWVRSAYANGIRAGANPDVVSSTILGVLSNANRPDSEVARAFVGTGKAIGKDQGFSTADREGIATRENDAALKRTSTAAGIAAGASRANNADNLTWQTNNPTEDRVKGKIAQQFIAGDPEGGKSLLFAPHNVGTGSQANYAPGDPRASGNAQVVTGPPSKDRFVETPDANGNPVFQPVAPGLPAMPKKSTADHFVQTPGPDGRPVYQPVAPGLPAVPQNYVQTPGADGKPVYQPVSPGLPAVPPKPIAEHFVQTPGADGKPVYQPVAPGLPAMPAKDTQPPMATPNAIGQLEMDALTSIGMWDGKNGVNPAFAQQYGPKMEAARIAAGNVLQQTRNAGAAQKAYMDALGIPSGSAVQTPGGISRLFGAPAVEVKPPAGATPPAPDKGADTLPANKAAGLKEGIMTTFGNGQVWTLNGGKPQRVK